MKEQLLKLAKLFNRADKLRLIKLFVLMIIGSLLDVASGGGDETFGALATVCG